MTPLCVLRAHRACSLSARALLVQQLKAFDTALETADRLIGEAEAEQASEHVEPLAYVPPGPWTGGPVGAVRLTAQTDAEYLDSLRQRPVPPGPWTDGGGGTVPGLPAGTTFLRNRATSGQPFSVGMTTDCDPTGTAPQQPYRPLMKIDRDQPVPTPDPDTPIPSDRQVFR